MPNGLKILTKNLAETKFIFKIYILYKLYSIQQFVNQKFKKQFFF